MSKVTMKDVAKKAGVSVATVSNVLNNIDNKANEVTQKKVLKAVKELNYQMDMTARSLSVGKSNLIGIFLPEVFSSGRPTSVLKDNPFFGEIISGIEYEARMQGYEIMITCVKSEQHVHELVNKRMLDGIALLGMHDDKFWSSVKALPIPKVLIDSYEHEAYGFSKVGTDDEEGAYLGTKHLIALGHTHIAFVSGSITESEVNAKRYQGFLRAIRDSNLNLADCPSILTDVNFKGGIMAGHMLINSNAHVTAAFAVADIMALGLIKIFHQIGKQVPRDLSVVGFDDLSVCEYSFPGLTTVRQDIYRKGLEVARLLIGSIQGEEVGKNLKLPVELVIRETAIPYKAGGQ